MMKNSTSALLAPNRLLGDVVHKSNLDKDVEIVIDMFKKHYQILPLYSNYWDEFAEKLPNGKKLNYLYLGKRFRKAVVECWMRGLCTRISHIKPHAYNYNIA